MPDLPPSILSHVSLGTNNHARARRFYRSVLETLSIGVVMDVDEDGVQATAFGRAYPEFWIQTPHNRRPAETANGVHVAFLAPSKAAVEAFHAAALAHGASDDGPPGPRPQYGQPYFGAFVRDPDGHKIEAMFWDEALARSLGMTAPDAG